MGKLDYMLSPCFCGGKRTIEYRTHTAGMGECYANWEMTCDKCHGLWTLSADNFYGSTPHTELEAVEIWNNMVFVTTEKLVELKIKYDNAMDLFCASRDKNTKLYSRINKAIEILNGEANEDEDAEYKVLEFDKVNHNGTIISKDAFKDQDGKLVPLKWGSGPDAAVLGTVELILEPDGVYMSIGKEDYMRLMEKMGDKDEFQKFLDGLFKEPMVVHRI